MPALNASSDHSPLAPVRAANVRCPRKSLPAKPSDRDRRSHCQAHEEAAVASLHVNLR